jgi:hypothetical protein
MHYTLRVPDTFKHFISGVIFDLADPSGLELTGQIILKFFPFKHRTDQLKK